MEPEAASIYCQYLKFAKDDATSDTLGVLKPGTKYMLADLGGTNTQWHSSFKDILAYFKETISNSKGPRLQFKSAEEKTMNLYEKLSWESIINMWE